MRAKIDLDCLYINLKFGGYCISPSINGEVKECSCSNYKVCKYFPKAELKSILESEKMENLEGSF